MIKKDTATAIFLLFIIMATMYGHGYRHGQKSVKKVPTQEKVTQPVDDYKYKGHCAGC